LLRRLAEDGHALDAYRAVPDRALAFESVAGALVLKKKAADLEALLAEHGKEARPSVTVGYYQGELHRLRGEWAEADRHLTALRRSAPKGREWQGRGPLVAVRVQRGLAVATAVELGGKKHDFEEVARACLQMGNVRQLEALVSARRAAHPEEADLPVWQV